MSLSWQLLVRGYMYFSEGPAREFVVWPANSADQQQPFTNSFIWGNGKRDTHTHTRTRMRTHTHTHTHTRRARARAYSLVVAPYRASRWMNAPQSVVSYKNTRVIGASFFYGKWYSPISRGNTERHKATPTFPTVCLPVCGTEPGIRGLALKASKLSLTLLVLHPGLSRTPG